MADVSSDKKKCDAKQVVQQQHCRCTQHEMLQMIQDYDCWVFDCDGELNSVLEETAMNYVFVQDAAARDIFISQVNGQQSGYSAAFSTCITSSPPHAPSHADNTCAVLTNNALQHPQRHAVRFPFRTLFESTWSPHVCPAGTLWRGNELIPDITDVLASLRSLVSIMHYKGSPAKMYSSQSPSCQ